MFRAVNDPKNSEKNLEEEEEDLAATIDADQDAHSTQGQPLIEHEIFLNNMRSAAESSKQVAAALRAALMWQHQFLTIMNKAQMSYEQVFTTLQSVEDLKARNAAAEAEKNEIKKLYDVLKASTRKILDERFADDLRQDVQELKRENSSLKNEINVLRAKDSYRNYVLEDHTFFTPTYSTPPNSNDTTDTAQLANTSSLEYKPSSNTFAISNTSGVSNAKKAKLSE